MFPNSASIQRLPAALRDSSEDVGVLSLQYLTSAASIKHHILHITRAPEKERGKTSLVTARETLGIMDFSFEWNNVDHLESLVFRAVWKRSTSYSDISPTKYL